jgi:hypothetical protein
MENGRTLTASLASVQGPSDAGACVCETKSNQGHKINNILPQQAPKQTSDTAEGRTARVNICRSLCSRSKRGQLRQMPKAYKKKKKTKIGQNLSKEIKYFHYIVTSIISAYIIKNVFFKQNYTKAY